VLLARLGDGVADMSLSAVDRLAIQADAFQLAKAGKLSTHSALALADRYRSEEDYTVWADLAGSLGDVMGAWTAEPCYEKLQKFVVTVMRDIVGKVGWSPKDGEHPLWPLLRPLAIGIAGRNGDSTVSAEAHKLFSAGWKSLHADMRFAVYSIVVATGGAAEFDAVLTIFKDADMAEERVRALRALGYAKDPALIERLLKMSTDGSVRSQDVFYIFATLANNKAGMQPSWQYVQDNWAKILEMFASGQFLLARILKSTTSCFASNAKADEVEAFFKAHEAPGAERAIQQALEVIRSNAGWLSKDGDNVAKWLEAHKDL
jgi:aminopeptidase N